MAESDKLDVEDLCEIMKKERYSNGYRYMSVYQIAIYFAEKYKKHPLVKQLSVGGRGTGESDSLAKRIAHFLKADSQKEDSQVEHDWLSNDCNLSFEDSDGNLVRTTQPGHSIFRLRWLDG